MALNRIRIIGGPGSGKTYVGMQLSKLFKMPHYDLDTLYWHRKDTDFSLKASEKTRNKRLAEIARGKQWIIEGSGSSWSGKSFEKADAILVLRTNKILRMLRIIKRSLFAHLRLEKRKRESLSGFIHFLKWNLTWEESHFPKFEKYLTKYRKKTRYFSDSNELVMYVLKHKG